MPPFSLAPGVDLKNSGLLRYSFGIPVLPEEAPQPVFPPLTSGDPPLIITCLGSQSDIDLDQDKQVFGQSPGHAFIPAQPGTFFTTTVPKRQGEAIRTRNAHFAGGRVPSGTRISAWFQPTDSLPLNPFRQAIVQTQVRENRLFVSPDDDDTDAEESPDGPLWLSSVRVAVALFSPGGPGSASVAGVLYVRAEHSIIDLPGGTFQDAQWKATFPS